MIKLRGLVFLVIALLTLTSCLRTAAAPPLALLATTPFPEGSQTGGLDGIFVSLESSAGAKQARCHSLYRFHPDGVVLYTSFSCFDTPPGAEDRVTIERWFHQDNVEISRGDYARLGQRLWIRVVAYDSIHETTNLRSFQGAICGDEMVLQEPAVLTYSGVPSPLTQPVQEYARLGTSGFLAGMPPSSKRQTSTQESPAVCQLSGFKILQRAFITLDGGSARFEVQTSPGETCSLVYTAPDGVPIQAPGSGTISADGQGICSWMWEVGNQEGQATVNITIGDISQNFALEIR